MSVLIKGLEMPATEYIDVRIFRDGTATLATGTKPYYRDLKAEPVRHGKWRIVNCATGFRCQCSECLHWVDIGTDRNYCPNCGARMDKE